MGIPMQTLFQEFSPFMYFMASALGPSILYFGLVRSFKMPISPLFKARSIPKGALVLALVADLSKGSSRSSFAGAGLASQAILRHLPLSNSQ